MSVVDNRDNLVKFYVDKGLFALSDAKLLAGNKSYSASINRLYYACYYIVTALLINNVSVRAKTHAGIKSLFNNHFVRQGIVDAEQGAFYSFLMDKRGEADYGDFEIVTEDDINKYIPQTEAFISAIKQLIELKQDC